MIVMPCYDCDRKVNVFNAITGQHTFSLTSINIQNLEAQTRHGATPRKLRVNID